MIWDTQNNQPLYAINQDALFRQLKRESRVVERCVIFFDYTVAIVPLFLSGMFLIEPIFQGRDFHQIFGALILIPASIYAFSKILERRKKEWGFEPTLLGQLDKTLMQLNHHIDRLRSLIWSLIAPLCLVVIIHTIATFHGKPWWLRAAFAICMIYSGWSSHRQIKCKLIPKRRELESLRKTLIEE